MNDGGVEESRCDSDELTRELVAHDAVAGRLDPAVARFIADAVEILAELVERECDRVAVIRRFRQRIEGHLLSATTGEAKP